jgi:PGF-pre-PGF domain-containing protein
VSVSFDSKKTTGKTTAIIEMLKGKSTLVSELPSDEVYKYLNIWVGNSGFATPQNIKNAAVNFKVEKSWIQNNGIDQTSIILNSYNDMKWDQLQTTQSGEDGKYVYFTAQTPAFSFFAITGKAVAKGFVNETESSIPKIGSLEQKNESSAPNVDQTPEQKQSPGTSGNGSTKIPDFELVYGIISLLAVSLYIRK